MTRTLVIAGVFPPQVGGSGRFLWELYRRQPAGEYCIAAGQHAEADAFDRSSPLPIHRLPLHVRSWGLAPLGFIAYRANVRRLQAIVRQERLTAVHAATLFPEGFLAWMLRRRLGLPYLCFLHGEELPIAAASRELAWMARRVLASARRIIVNSQNTRTTLLRTFPVDADRVAVVTPGVDVERFAPAAPDPAARERLGWTGRRVVLTVGRLQERKGHDRFIQAIPLIRHAIPDLLYAIVGAGQQRAALESLVDELHLRDFVRFHGELGDHALIECYQQCDLAVLPNRAVRGDFEGFGMVLVEAQACGKPVLTGVSGGTPETIDPGVTGEAVDCDRVEVLAAAATRLLRDQAKREVMGRAARDWALNRFDWTRLAEQVSHVFREVSGDHPAPTAAVPACCSPGVRPPFPSAEIAD